MTIQPPVIQLGEAFRAQGEEVLGRSVYAAARCPDWFDAPPGETYPTVSR